MKKKNTSFSISEKTLDDFNKYCIDNCINKSSLVEKLILQHMEGRRAKK